MQNNLFLKAVLPLLLSFFGLTTQAQKSATGGHGGHTVSLEVTEKGTKEPVIMGTCQLKPAGAMAVTDMDGKATLKNVPSGTYTLTISYVGFEPISTQVKVERNMSLKFQMIPTSLALKEVTVTAKRNESGTSTSSIVGRQAIDHLQANSLADIMQLIPGQLMGNQDLTSQSNLQLRTLVNNNTSAFGSSIVVDGMPMSNNGNVSQGSFSSTAFAGTDLRQVSADNINEVEVIRGIPSAEYGDLTSGLVVVHSKVGVTPWQAKAKINPSTMNYSLGKGFNLGKAGILNINADYAQAWGDPRQKTRSYDRYTLNLGYGYDISKKWHTNTKLRIMNAKDWSGNDPDAIDDGTYFENKNLNINVTHNGRIQVDKPLMRTLSYTAGLSVSKADTKNSSYVTGSGGMIPIITAMETGYYAVPWMTQSYLATGITESRPGNLYLKVNDAFFLRKGKTIQSFKLGADYRYDWNNGKGYYNEDDAHPYRPNSDGRPRAFSDIPGLHQLSAYAEDALTWNINKVNRLKATAGIRFTAMQPFGDVATTAVSPRLNMSFDVTKWMTLRGGVGMNSKTPGLNYLYPDKKYNDRVAASYMPQNDPAAQLLYYHTQMYEVKFSKDMKNATTTKVEVGVDFKLPGNRHLSLLAYRDKTPKGFGPVTEYMTYTANYFGTEALIISPGQATQINFNSPTRQDVIFMTTGRVGNTNSTTNRGIEFDIDFGEIKPLRTQLMFSGALNETKTWSTDTDSRSIPASLLPTSYSAYGLTPCKVVYPSGQDYDKYRRFVNTLRTVTHIPELKMVASFTAQVIWQDYRHSAIFEKRPIGWIDTDLQYHEVTSQTEIEGVSMERLTLKSSDALPVKQPVTWNLQGRLTKELGKIGQLSLYVNNLMFYEPYMKTNISNTLVQRNTGTFSYGVELSFNL